MNILITGAFGFVGRYLVEALEEFYKTQDLKVFGTVHSQESLYAASAQYPQVEWLSGDLLEKEFVDEVVSKSKPELVFHLAALASAGASFKFPVDTLVNNIKGQALLLEALKEQKSGARILIAGSIDEYGVAELDQDVTEQTPFMPVSPYGVSKVAQDYLGLQYYLSHQLKVVRVRPSNHIGPRQKGEYVLPSFCHQVARIEAGKQEPQMRVGNLEAIRDFTDVRDMVNAYILALEQGVPGEAYVLGSGVGTKIKDLLTLIISMSSVNIEVVRDEQKFRANDIQRLVVNPAKFKKQTSWEPHIPIEQSIYDILNYWRKSVAEEL